MDPGIAKPAATTNFRHPANKLSCFILKPHHWLVDWTDILQLLQNQSRDGLFCLLSKRLKRPGRRRYGLCRGRSTWLVRAGFLRRIFWAGVCACAAARPRYRVWAYLGLMPQEAPVPEALAMHCRREENWQLPGKPQCLPCRQYLPAAAG